MMISDRVTANRKNSQLSTGPRTAEGKAASSRNHLTHGFCAADPVLPAEDRNEFNELLDRFRSEHNPGIAHEEFLVQEIAGARWKLARLIRTEVQMLAALASPDEAFADKDKAAAFQRLQRYRAMLERTYHRCIRELRASKKDQFEAKVTKAADKRHEKFLARAFQIPPEPDFNAPIEEDPDPEPVSAQIQPQR